MKPRRQHSIPWSIAAWLWGCWWIGVSTLADADEPRPLGDQVRTLVESLSSDDFASRQTAEDTLQKLGPEAFDPLIAALAKANTDTAQIILSSLERIWLASPEPGADRLERRLYELTWEPGPFQPAIEAILQRHALLREMRAIKALRRMNAYVKLVLDEGMMDLLYEANGQVPKNGPQRIQQIVIPRSWKGTSADLWHFRRITHSSFFQIYYVKGSLSEADCFEIARTQTEIAPQERSEVFLGITSDMFNGVGLEGCLVKDVEPDGAAQAAGIQSYDLITRIDEVEIKNFQELVKTLKGKRAFEEFTVTVQRDYKTLTLPVIGLPWELRRFECPPPPPEADQLLEGVSPKYRETPNFLPPPEDR